MTNNKCSRRVFLKLTAVTGVSSSLHPLMTSQALAAPKKQPNFVIIFCDDLGYGDLGVFGNPTIKTPNLDRMANEGQKWTSFYAAASVCTPSRAAILTGRLPIRSGMCSDKRRVLFPDSAGGLPASEITIANALKPAGYTSACIGKWHLGHLRKYLPTNHGFDSYFGIPYSNDMDNTGKSKRPFKDSKIEYFNVPLMRDTEIVERPADQTTITKRYTDETVKFIKQNKNKPCFAYLAHSMPHVPLFRSKDFADTSLRGLFGDVIEEIDHGVGRILDTLNEQGIAEKTLVVFTSDNGPWLSYKQQGGSAGPLRGGKGGTFEGGMREPTIFWWPGTIKQDVIMEMGSTLDLLPTFCSLAGAKVPTDRIIDGVDLTDPLTGKAKSPRDIMFFYRGTRIFAIRKGMFKAHFITKPEYGGGKEIAHETPLLYHLGHDPAEKYDVASQHPDVIADIKNEMKNHQAKLVPAIDQLALRIKK
ncbi:MAG: sulfatase [Anaerohalosphaera sp.]|nr:sulfatase [Anaerohalosphaera sp.]